VSGSSVPVLLDNCAISACCEVGAWNALCGYFDLETVEQVASEAATGASHREIIDPTEFRSQVTVHNVSRKARLEKQAEFAELANLDDGERDLWVHALDRTGSWILCGPDTASIRFGVRAGHGDKLISLEELCRRMGYTPKKTLKSHQTSVWLRARISEFSTELAFEALARKK